MEHAEVPGSVREERLRGWIAQYSEAILKTCFLYLSDRSQAEDALQDTFLKAWRHMAEYEKKRVENEKAWLLRIAVNTCRDYRRSAWFRHTDFRQAAEDLPPRREELQPQDHTLALCVGQLPDKYRQVISLHYWQQLSIKDVAQVLGIPVSTAHHRLHKAEALLREEWLGGENG